jgi:hypothetical protein
MHKEHGKNKWLKKKRQQPTKYYLYRFYLCVLLFQNIGMKIKAASNKKKFLYFIQPTTKTTKNKNNSDNKNKNKTMTTKHVLAYQNDSSV